MPFDKQDIDVSPFNLPGELTQPADQLRLLLAVRHEVRAVIAQDEESLLLLRDVLKHAHRVLSVGNRGFILTLQFRSQDLAQSRYAAPDEESLLFFLVTLQLCDG